MRRYTLAFTFVVLFSLILTPNAYASTLALASGPSPYASCSPAGQPGTNYLNAEVEPWIASNPANPSNLISVWQQDRWSNGGSRGLAGAYSFNKGQSWTEFTLPFDRCGSAGVPYERASDPWVSIGPDGTAYAVSLTFNVTNNNNAILSAISHNGGQSWGTLRTVVSYVGNGGQFSTDKEAVTADPVKPGVAYVVWDTLIAPTDNPHDFPHASAFRGPGYFSRTTDGGQTWSTPQVLVNTPQNKAQTIGNQIVVDPRTGTLYDFFDLILNNNKVSKYYNVAFVKSTDGGLTWSEPQIIDKLQTGGVADPNTGADIRTGDIIPEPAIDPATGQLYIVWQDRRFNGGHYDEVALSTSKDGGNTWSAPVRVNTPTGTPAFTPAIAVNASDAVAVTFYDFRNLTNQTTTLPTDYWLVTSSNGGASFGNEVHVAGPFDMLTAPFASGYFVGDYEGLTAAGNTFVPFFVMANSGNTSNRTDASAALI